MILPKVSVVVPTFERPTYLLRSIKSVLKQNYKNLEIIIVIDGQSEITKKAINSIYDNTNIYIDVIETIDKVGGSEARNIGVEHSSGEFIAFLDDDDEWLEDKITSQINLINKNRLTQNDHFLCFSSLWTYSYKNNKKNFKKLPWIDYDNTNKKSISSYLFEPLFFKRKGFIQTSTILVPKKLVEEIPFTKGLVKHQDWDWLINLENNFNLKVIQIKEPKVIYHMDVPVQKSVGRTHKWKFSEQWLNKKKFELTQKSYYSLFLGILYSISSDMDLENEEKKEELKIRLKNLPLRLYLKPYTWKIIIYIIKNSNYSKYTK